MYKTVGFKIATGTYPWQEFGLLVADPDKISLEQGLLIWDRVGPSIKFEMIITNLLHPIPCENTTTGQPLEL